MVEGFVMGCLVLGLLYTWSSGLFVDLSVGLFVGYGGDFKYEFSYCCILDVWLLCVVVLFMPRYIGFIEKFWVGFVNAVLYNCYGFSVQVFVLVEHLILIKISGVWVSWWVWCFYCVNLVGEVSDWYLIFGGAVRCGVLRLCGGWVGFILYVSLFLRTMILFCVGYLSGCFCFVVSFFLGLFMFCEITYSLM
eukprot:gene3527-2478_t